MKNSIHFSKPTRWTLAAAFLAAAAGLSGPLTKSTAGFQMRELASVSKTQCTPSLQESLQYSDTASCSYHKEVNGVSIVTEVNVSESTRQLIDRSGSENVTKPQVGFEISARTYCENCADLGIEFDEVTIDRFEPRQSNRIDSVAYKLIQANNRTIEPTLKEQRELVKAKENCEVDASGEKIERTDRFNCRVDRLELMDEEEGAKYYKAHVEGEIRALLESGDTAQIKRGQLLAKQIGMNTSNKFVRDSLVDLNNFGDAQVQMNSLQTELDKLAGNNSQQAQAQRQQLLARMQMIKNQYSSFYSSRTSQVQNLEARGITDPLFQELASSADQLKTSLDSRFDAIVGAHKTMLGQTDVNTNGQTLPAGVVPAGTTSRTTNGGYTPSSCAISGIPQLGQPVNGSCGTNLGQTQQRPGMIQQNGFQQNQFQQNNFMQRTNNIPQVIR